MCLVCVINLSQSVENNEEKARLSASFFVTFFREKKVEFCSSKTTYCGASASLSLAFSFAKNTLERSFVVYRLSDCVWWWWSKFGGVACLLLRRTCAFSLVVVKVLFFPLYRRRATCTATHKSKALTSLLNLFLQILSFLVVKVASRRRADFSQTLTRSPTILSFSS